SETGPDDDVWRTAVDALPGKRDAPVVRPEEPGDAVEERRLTGAVGADQRGDRCRLDRQRCVDDGADAGECLAHPACVEQRAHSRTISSRGPRRPCGRKRTSAMIASPITISRT